MAIRRNFIKKSAVLLLTDLLLSSLVFRSLLCFISKNCPKCEFDILLITALVLITSYNYIFKFRTTILTNFAKPIEYRGDLCSYVHLIQRFFCQKIFVFILSLK